MRGEDHSLFLSLSPTFPLSLSSYRCAFGRMSTVVVGRGTSHSQLSSTYEHACGGINHIENPLGLPLQISLSFSLSLSLSLSLALSHSHILFGYLLVQLQSALPTSSCTWRIHSGLPSREGIEKWGEKRLGEHPRYTLGVKFNDDVHHSLRLVRTIDWSIVLPLQPFVDWIAIVGQTFSPKDLSKPSGDRLICARNPSKGAMRIDSPFPSSFTSNGIGNDSLTGPTTIGPFHSMDMHASCMIWRSHGTSSNLVLN